MNKTHKKIFPLYNGVDIYKYLVIHWYTLILLECTIEMAFLHCRENNFVINK